MPHGEGLPLPAYATEHAAGLDVVAAEDLTLAPGAAPRRRDRLRASPSRDGYEVQVRPRSGLALKHGITCLNTPGTIDSDYRGEVKVILANLGGEPFEVARGERIAQLVPAPVLRAALRARSTSSDDTARGAGGFGSTGTVTPQRRPARPLRPPHRPQGDWRRGPAQAARRAQVALIGAGGIGSPAIQYLAAAGVGALRVIDDDGVSLDNLQRQILFGTGDVGRAKTEVAGEAVGAAQSRTSRFEGLASGSTGDNVAGLLDGADLVLDGSDNFATRLVVSDHCTAAAHSARLGGDRPVPGRRSAPSAAGRPDQPCYRCFVGDAFDAEDCDSCSELGVLGAMAGIAGSWAAMEAIRADHRLRRGRGRQAPCLRRAQAGDADAPDRQGSRPARTCGA